MARSVAKHVFFTPSGLEVALFLCEDDSVRVEYKGTRAHLKSLFTSHKAGADDTIFTIEPVKE